MMGKVFFFFPSMYDTVYENSMYCEFINRMLRSDSALMLMSETLMLMSAKVRRHNAKQREQKGMELSENIKS